MTDINLYINDVIFNYYFVIGGLFLSYLVYRILHSMLAANNYIQTKYKIHGHTWRSIECNKSIPYNIHVGILYYWISIIIFKNINIWKIWALLLNCESDGFECSDFNPHESENLFYSESSWSISKNNYYYSEQEIIFLFVLCSAMFATN